MRRGRRGLGARQGAQGRDDGRTAGEFLDFAFADNAGYPSPVHQAALRELGPTPYHRLSWAYLDALPAWRHLKKIRLSPEAAELESGGQLGFEF